jgi:sulfur carrier protein ThiS
MMNFFSNISIQVVVFIAVFLLTLISGPFLIPFLKRLKFGQTVRDDGPLTHLIKTGTPTMGGIIFLIPIILTSLFFARSNPQIAALAFATVGFGIIGFVDDFIKDSRVKKILFNGSELDITTKAILNGSSVSLKAPVNEGDRLHIEEIRTIKDLAKFSEINLGEFDIFVNDSKVSENYVIKADDIIETVIRPEDEWALQSDTEIEFEEDEVEITFNHIKNIMVTVNGEDIELKGKANYIFVDVFNHYNFDMSDPKGSVIVKLNGSKASFTDSIRNGDKIEILWERN